MNNKLMFSSENQKWSTRQEVFASIQEQLGRSYNLDPCCEVETAKCENFITAEEDMFRTNWFHKTGSDKVNYFMNPPYGRDQIRFVNYGAKMCIDFESRVVGDILIPARTDTKLFHETIIPHATTIRFIKGRLVFGDDAYWEWLWEQPEVDGKKNSLYQKHGSMNAAPFPSMIVSFGENKKQTIETITLAKAKYGV